MDLLGSLKGMLGQYVSGTASESDAAGHFQQVAASADADTVAQGIAAAMRSDQTPPFGQLVSQLFANGSADQKSGMLNALLSAVSPEQRAQLAGMIPGLAAGGLGVGQTPNLSPDAVATMAQHVEQHNPGVVETMSSFYAAHPTLVKTLGSAAMMIAMRKIAERHGSNA